MAAPAYAQNDKHILIIIIILKTNDGMRGGEGPSNDNKYVCFD